MDKCREEFEQYIRSQSGFTADFKIGCNGQYKSDLMHFMFITWQEQQKRIDELQARVNAALQEIKGAARWIDEDAIDDPDFIKGGALRALKRLEQALKGGEV